MSHPGSADRDSPDTSVREEVALQTVVHLSDGPDREDLPRVGARYIWLLVLASIGAWMADIAVLSYSMAVRIDQLAPGHAEYLGYLTGVGGVVTLLASPLFGVLSDRTRSRLGRRRPFLIGGLVLGMVALVVMAVAPSIPVLGVGWVLAVLGWGNVMNGITYLQADKLPAAQRGRVSGYTGFAQMLAAVLGVGVATVLVGNNFLLLLGPAVLGTVLLVPLLIWTYDPDSRAAVAPERLGVRRMVGKYVFDPRRHPDFSWNWLGRLLFYIGLTFNTTFVTFLLAQRLDVSVDKVGGVAALVAGVGVVGTTIGAIGGGVASDRLGRRRIFVLASGAVFCLGAVTMALSASLAILIVGSTVTNLGVGMFSAVDQAVLLDVLPSRAEAGRYLGIMTYAQEIPRALAPLAAAPLLAIGAVGASKNYTVLYLVGGVVTLLGGLIIMQRVKGSR